MPKFVRYLLLFGFLSGAFLSQVFAQSALDTAKSAQSADPLESSPPEDHGESEPLDPTAIIHKQAVALAREGQLGEALILIAGVYKEAPQNPLYVGDYILILTWNEAFHRALEIYEAFPEKATLPEYVFPAVAKAWRETNQYDRALPAYAAYVKTHPDDRDVFLGYIAAFFEAKEWRAAQKVLRDKIATDPHDRRLLSLLAVTYAQEAEWDDFFAIARKLKESASSEKAEETITAEVTQGFDQAYAFAIAQSRTQEYAPALNILGQLKELGYNVPAVTTDMIVIKTWHGDYSSAVAEFENLPEDFAHPDYLLKAVAGAYEETSRPAKALELYRTLLKASPQDMSLQKTVLRLSLETNDYETADQMLTVLLSEDPENMDYQIEKAHLLLKQERFAQVLELLSSWDLLPGGKERAEELTAKLIPSLTDPDWLNIYQALSAKDVRARFSQSEARLLLAWFEARETGRDDFILFKDSLLAHVDTYTAAWRLQLAEFLKGLKYTQEVELIFISLLKESPDHPVALKGLAGILVGRKDYDEALRLLDLALVKSPQDAGALFLKAEILETKKEYLRAVEVYNRILAQNPENRAAFNLKNRALMDLGANSLALGKMEAEGERKDPVLFRRAKGNILMNQIRWQESAEVLKVLSAQPVAGISTSQPYESMVEGLEKDPESIILGNQGYVYRLGADPLELDRDEMIKYVLDSWEKDGSGAKDKIVFTQPREAESSILEEGVMAKVAQHMDPTVYAQEDSVDVPVTAAVSVPTEGSVMTAPKPGGEAVPVSPESALRSEDAQLRSQWDRMLALREQKEMEILIQEYERFQSQRIEIPYWVHEVAGDAYLYLRQPEKALEIYQRALQSDPKSHNTRLAIYHTYVELGRFSEAQKALDELDADTPVRVVDRGILKDNWKKAEIAINRAWLLMYQDRFAEAEQYLAEMARVSPFNTNVRSAMAHAHLWRGWPRKALEEFKIVETMDINNIPASNGYCVALNSNIHKTQARQTIAQVLAQEPKNVHTQRIKRSFDIEEMTLLTVDTYLSREFPGEDEYFVSVRVDEPVTYHHTLFAELLRRETTQENGNDWLDRGIVGDQWQPNNFWKLVGAISQEIDTGDNFGWFAQAIMTPDDHWTFDASYDSWSLDVPLRSRSSGIDASDASLVTTFRASERFNTSWGVTFRDFTDGNAAMSYLWKTDTALTTRAYWRTRLGTEFYAGSNSKTDNIYFSPESIYSFTLVPMVEHVWYRRYEKSMVDRFWLGVGQQWQEEYPGENIGYIRYEQDYRFSDTFGWLIGTTYSLRNYDGDDVNNWNIYSTLKKNF